VRPLGVQGTVYHPLDPKAELFEFGGGAARPLEQAFAYGYGAADMAGGEIDREEIVALLGPVRERKGSVSVGAPHRTLYHVLESLTNFLTPHVPPLARRSARAPFARACRDTSI